MRLRTIFAGRAGYLQATPVQEQSGRATPLVLCRGTRATTLNFQVSAAGGLGFRVGV